LNPNPKNRASLLDGGKTLKHHPLCPIALFTVAATIVGVRI